MSFSSEVPQDKPPRTRANGKTEVPKVVPWWEYQWVAHPMSQLDYVRVFCEFILCRSEDPTLRGVRNRAYAYIKTVMKQEIEKSLQVYRQEHPYE